MTARVLCGVDQCSKQLFVLELGLLPKKGFALHLVNVELSCDSCRNHKGVVLQMPVF